MAPKTTVVRELQDSKTFIPTLPEYDVILKMSGKVILVRPHPEKAKFPIVIKLRGNVIEVNEVQPAKA